MADIKWEFSRIITADKKQEHPLSSLEVCMILLIGIGPAFVLSLSSLAQSSDRPQQNSQWNTSWSSASTFRWCFMCCSLSWTLPTHWFIVTLTSFSPTSSTRSPRVKVAFPRVLDFLM